MTARTRCGWAKLRECGELLYGRRFPPKLKGAVYKSYVRPANLDDSEAACLKESETGILRRIDIHGQRNVWSTLQRYKKSYGLDADDGFE